MALVSSRDETVIPMPVRGEPRDRDADITKAVEETEKALAQFVAPSTLEVGEQSAKRIRDAAEQHAKAVEARGDALVEVATTVMANARDMREQAAQTASSIRADGARQAAEIYRTAHETYEWNEMMKAMARKHQTPPPAEPQTEAPADEQQAEQAAAGIAESDDVAASRG